MAAWEQLLTVLQEQVRLYDVMVELSSKKAELIVDGKVRDLEKLVQTEEGLLTQGGKLEAERYRLQHALGDALELSEDETTLRRLIAHAPVNRQQELVDCERALVQAVKGLGEKNQLNGQLLKHALKLVNYQLSLLEPDASGMERRAYLDRKA